MDNIKLNFDEATKKTFNQPGVETRIPDFGDPSRVEYLDPSRLAIAGDYFSHISDTLVSLGYIRGENLHGAPFDFRKGPSKKKYIILLIIYYNTVQWIFICFFKFIILKKYINIHIFVTMYGLLHLHYSFFLVYF